MGILNTASDGLPSVLVALVRTLRSQGPLSRDELLALLESCGALADARQRLTQAVWTARTALKDLPESPRRDALDSVVLSLLPPKQPS